LKFFNQQKGFALIEVVLLLVIMAIAVFPLSKLLSTNLKSSAKTYQITRASFYAQEKLEEVIADYKNMDTRGYDWICAPERYSSDTPESGIYRYVSIDSTGKRIYGERCAEVIVGCDISGFDRDLMLKTWLVEP
jgi:type II secretory pathway pseudopilin PulG